MLFTYTNAAEIGSLMVRSWRGLAMKAEYCSHMTWILANF